MRRRVGRLADWLWVAENFGIVLAIKTWLGWRSRGERRG